MDQGSEECQLEFPIAVAASYDTFMKLFSRIFTIKEVSSSQGEERHHYELGTECPILLPVQRSLI